MSDPHRPEQLRTARQEIAYLDETVTKLVANLAAADGRATRAEARAVDAERERDEARKELQSPGQMAARFSLLADARDRTLAVERALASAEARAAAATEALRAAQAFLATTSYFRQPKHSRPEFEALAEALASAGAQQEPPPPLSPDVRGDKT